MPCIKRKKKIIKIKKKILEKKVYTFLEKKKFRRIGEQKMNQTRTKKTINISFFE